MFRLVRSIHRFEYHLQGRPLCPVPIGPDPGREYTARSHNEHAVTCQKNDEKNSHFPGACHSGACSMGCSRQDGPLQSVLSACGPGRIQRDVPERLGRDARADCHAGYRQQKRSPAVFPVQGRQRRHRPVLAEQDEGRGRVAGKDPVHRDR